MKNNIELTQNSLKEILNYDPMTGFFTWIKSTGRRVKIGSIAGSSNGGGYLIIQINSSKMFVHRLAWMYVYGEWPKDQIDHINHNKKDNRIENLRNVSRKENGRNQSISIKNVSGAVGVAFHKRLGKFQSKITVDGKIIYLGLFQKIEDAIIARKDANIKYGFHINHGT